jgi:hypothetical protein
MPEPLMIVLGAIRDDCTAHHHNASVRSDSGAMWFDNAVPTLSDCIIHLGARYDSFVNRRLRKGQITHLSRSRS